MNQNDDLKEKSVICSINKTYKDHFALEEYWRAKVMEVKKCDNPVQWLDDHISFVGICTCCNSQNFCFSTKKQVEDHLTSEEHKKNLQNIKNSSPELYVGICKLCKSCLNSLDQFKDHLKGKKHKKNLRNKL